METLLDQAVQLKPKREYVVIYCDTEAEWDRLKAVLGLRQVRRGGKKQGSAWDQIGTQRVVRAAEFLDLLDRTEERTVDRTENSTPEGGT